MLCTLACYAVTRCLFFLHPKNTPNVLLERLGISLALDMSNVQEALDAILDSLSVCAVNNHPHAAQHVALSQLSLSRTHYA